MKIKVMNLFLSVLLSLSLVACGSPFANKDMSSEQTSNSSLYTVGSESNQNSTSAYSNTQSDTESAQTNADESTEVVITEANNTVQNSNDVQVVKENNKEQVTQAQNNVTQSNSNSSDSNTVIGGSVLLETKQEAATSAPIVGNGNTSSVTVNSVSNNFDFIEASGSFKSYEAYVQYLKNSGATYVSSTEEAIAIIKNAIKTSQYGVNLCFSGNVDTNLLVNALPKDTTLSGYYDINISECEYKSNKFYFGVKFTWWTSPSEEAVVNALVAQVLPSLNQGTTYNKIKNVHDYIANNVNYDEDTLAGLADKYSAYDALIGHSAVCQGYALAFQKFMDAMGIESCIAKGDINVAGASGPHAWNLVKLNGSWYSVDCTWDGQDNTTKYNYFLIGANEYPYGITGGISLAASKYIN